MHNRAITIAACFLGLVLSFVSRSDAFDYDVVELPTPHDVTSVFCSDMSLNADIIVGHVAKSGEKPRAIVWSRTNNGYWIDHVPFEVPAGNKVTASRCWGVSDDGKIVCGEVELPISETQFYRVGFYWNRSQPKAMLLHEPSRHLGSTIRSVCSDTGLYLGGAYFFAPGEASGFPSITSSDPLTTVTMLRSQSSGTSSQGNYNPSDGHILSLSLNSSDGLVAVGYLFANKVRQPHAWQQVIGWKPINLTPGGNEIIREGEASSISRDGAYAVGTIGVAPSASLNKSVGRAFRCRLDGSLSGEFLMASNGSSSTRTTAEGIANDGTVVGREDDSKPNASKAVIWKSTAKKATLIADHVSAQGKPFTADFSAGVAISADASCIVVHGDGPRKAYILRSATAR